MIMIILAVMTAVIGLGLAATAFIHYKTRIHFMYGVGALLATIVLVPICIYTGWQMGKASKMSFSEFWNGWEKAAIKERIECHRDGNCRYEYDCDPYLVTVSYSCNCNKNGCSTCYRTETRYHDCPYVDAEYNYTVRSTLEDFTIDSNRLPDNPQSHRWRFYKRVPDHVIESAGTGDPKFWTDVKNRVESNKPGPVSVMRSYNNIIYASDTTILKQYSSDVQSLKKKGLLPSIMQNEISNFYHTNKVYLVGISLPNYEDWKTKLEYFNASLGSRLQGDLYIVIVDAKKVTDRFIYALALKAHWQDSTQFDKRTLSKNAVVVIMGTDGKTVNWTSSFTGMPMGNDLMTNRIRDKVKGMELNPDLIIGSGNGKNVGIIGDIVFGLTDKATKFQRVRMRSYNYLINEIDPTGSYIGWIIFFTILICLLPWGVSIFIAYLKENG